MNVRPIRDEADYDWALAEIEAYHDAEPARGCPDGDRYEVLLALVGAYEDRHHPIGPADPIETIQGVMEARGLKQRDLADVLGSAPRASEVLSRKRALTRGMVHRISTAWRVPADLLVAPYRLSAGGRIGAGPAVPVEPNTPRGPARTPPSLPRS